MFDNQSHLLGIEPFVCLLIPLGMELLAQGLAAFDPSHQVVHRRAWMLRIGEVTQRQLLLRLGADRESLRLRGGHDCASFPFF